MKNNNTIAKAILMALIFICIAVTANAQSGTKWATGLNNCSGTDAMGTSNSFPIVFATNNTARMWLTPAGNLGLGFNNPIYKFDVNGRVHATGNIFADSCLTAMNLYAVQKVTADALQVNNNAQLAGLAVFGNKITVDGNNSSISSNTGILNFQNNNLITGGNLNAANLNLSSLQGTGKMLLQADSTGKLIPFALPNNSDVVLYGNGMWGMLPQKSPWIADSIGIYPDSTLTNTNVFVDRLFASRSVSIGTFRFKNGLPGERDTISAEKRITIYAPSRIELNADTLTMKNRVGIGVANPQSALDVAGDINASGTVYANNLYAQNSIAIGTLKISNGAPGSGKDSIASPYKLALVSAGREISLISDTVKVGDYNSTVRFDVNGSVRVRDMLWVEDGIIVGKKFEGSQGKIDTMSSERTSSKYVEAESIKADTVTTAISKTDSAFTQRLIVAGDAKIVGNTTINGNLKVLGSLTGITGFDSLHVLNKIKVGNSISIDYNPLLPTQPNNIYADGDLFIQSQSGSPFNTILNRNNSNVGIGIPASDYYGMFPDAKLDIRGKVIEPFGVTAKPVFKITEESACYPDPGSHSSKANILEIKKVMVCSTPIIKYKHILVVTDTGNVGIGTDKPIQNFHVEGNSYFDGNVGIGTINPTSIVDISSVGTEYTNTLPRVINTGNAGAGWQFVPGGGAKTWYVHATGPGNSQHENKFVFKTSDTTDVMILTAEGNVGIGTDNPGYKLDVCGTIRAKEIITELTQCPDFVFESDYYLMPLSDLEYYLKINKHLPDIPSASEVKNEGFKVTEMNSLMLQKIEELTLYVIQQNKKIEELQNKLNEIEK